jgi:hypothetical protein
MVFGVVFPGAIIVATLLPFLLFHARLPDHLATGLSWSGRLTSTTPLSMLELGGAGLAVFGALRMFVLAFRRAGRGDVCGPLGTTTSIATIYAIWMWFLVLANLDALGSGQAGAVNMGLFAMLVGAGIALGAVVARGSVVLEMAPGITGSRLPSAGLAPGERAMWVGTARTRWSVPMALFLGALYLISPPGPYSLFTLIAALYLLLFSFIRVTVDRHGVRIAHGLLGWPVQRVGLARIRGALPLEVKLGPWGEYLYPFSLTLYRSAAIVPRAGPGVRLQLDGERVLDIALDDAEQAAGVINDLVDTNHAAKQRDSSPQRE